MDTDQNSSDVTVSPLTPSEQEQWRKVQHMNPRNTGGVQGGASANQLRKLKKKKQKTGDFESSTSKAKEFGLAMAAFMASLDPGKRAHVKSEVCFLLLIFFLT
jgi:hypothetical protein